MKDILRTRLEFLWAKLAGRDVDIDTLTPDAPTNMIEKLMLETADRIAGSSGGGGGVIIIDHDSLSQTERTVDFIHFGEVVKDFPVCLYDIDPNSQYRIYMHDDLLSVSSFNLILMIENSTVSECSDIESEEDFELAQTISGEVPLYGLECAGDINVYILPTTTQFKTYKRASGQ